MTRGPDDLAPKSLDYDAWVLLANVSEGDWSKQTPEWQAAVVRWRDAFHASLKAECSLLVRVYGGGGNGQAIA